MPRFDGTGPTGRGPITGRGMGRCRSVKSVNNPGRDIDPQLDNQNSGNFPGFFQRLGKGFGMGRGRGSGLGGRRGR